MAVRLNVMHERFETDDLECKLCFFFRVQVVAFLLYLFYSIWLLSFAGAIVAFIWILYFHLERRSPAYCQKQLQNIVIISLPLLSIPNCLNFYRKNKIVNNNGAKSFVN